MLQKGIFLTWRTPPCSANNYLVVYLIDTASSFNGGFLVNHFGPRALSTILASSSSSKYIYVYIYIERERERERESTSLA